MGAWKGVTDADVTLTDKPVTINWNNFVAKRANLEQVGTTATVTDGTVTFHGLNIGAYYVYAQSDKHLITQWAKLFIHMMKILD